MLRLQLLGQFQFGFGLFFLAHVAIGLAQQVVSHCIIRIHRRRFLQRTDRQMELAFFLQHGGIRVKVLD